MPNSLLEMDFDLDDPLGDLLSDGSNDSFFGATKKKLDASKSSTQSSGDTKTKSAKVADLFGIDSKKSEESLKITSKPSSDSNPVPNQSFLTSNSKKIADEEDSAVGSTKTLRQSIKRSTTERSTQQVSAIGTEELNRMKIASTQNQSTKKDTQFDDSDDFLNELGFDPKHPKGNVIGGKKTNILDDILNFTKPESIVTPKSSSPALKPNPSDGDRNSSQATDIHQTSNRYSPSSRRARNLPRSGSSDADAFGIFSSPLKQKNKIQETKKTDTFETSIKRQKPAKKPTVDWLGLDSENEIKSSANISASVQLEKVSTQTEQPTNFDDSTKLKAISSSTVSRTNDTSNVGLPIETMTLTPTNTIQANLNMINVTSLEQEKVLQSLKQQEMHLRIAAQMKQQESVLHDMHAKQQMLINQQESQLNDLFRRQVDRQNQLETQLQQQQEKINSYINMLMSQTNVGFIATTKFAESDEMTETEKSEHDISRQNLIKLEAEVKRLEVEKIRLEDILQSVTSSHEQELELLHISHKKQISLLEEGLESLEKRLREEIKSTEAYHLNKISALQADIMNQQQKYEENTKKLIDDYEKQIEKLRFNFENDLKTLTNDQRSTIENIRQVKLFEFAALQESGSYLNTLKNASDQLENATGNLESMRTNITSTIERIHDEREAQLNVKESNLNKKQDLIDKCIEKNEEERRRLIELVKSLEIKLNSVEQNSVEEQWNLRQKSATLEAEKVSFEREKTFVREKLAAEEKRIQNLKEKQFEEHKHLMDLIDAEREQISVEKAKFETMERLKMSSCSSSIQRQSELDAAIKIAQDAAKSADTEREHFLEQQRKLKSKERELMDKENQFQSQQIELESRLSEANDQKIIAEHATRTCKTLEQKLLAKLQTLQDNYMELTEREAKLAQAKMELGKERMELEHLKQQLRQSKCSLCRIGVKNTEISELNPLNDITVHDKPLKNYDIFSTSSFDVLHQRLSNVEALIDDAVVNVPQSPKSHHFPLSSDEHLLNSNSLSKSIINPF